MVSSKARLSLARSAPIDAPLPGAGRLAALFAPLDMLLCEGGDDRLDLEPGTGQNVYGCRPAPRADAIAFSSSTATSISDRAYRRARRAQESLIERACVVGLLEAFDTHIEHLRHALRGHLGLEGSGAQVVFSPSGTDSQLHVLFVAQLLLDAPLTSIVVGSDQTGSGTVHTAHARHFASRTARGRAVGKGSVIAGWTGDIAKIEIPFAEPDGAVRTGAQMDGIVLAAVAAEVERGRHVVLQAMNASKFGWRAPSDACLFEIASRWPSRVQIVVDACQMRLSRARIADYLNRDFLVLLTGSKFFTGPPFCGALLVPQPLSQRLAAMSEMPAGLFDYADRSDLPQLWHGLREDLSLRPNFGQWLRWEAALEEMRCYYALPQSYRSAVLCGLADAIPRVLASSVCLQYWPMPQSLGCNGDEFDSPTVFPFLLRNGQSHLGAEEARVIYHALNRDVSAALPPDATPDQRTLAARACHIGQPVALRLADGTQAAALRIAIGARALCESWSPQVDAAGLSIESVMADIAIVVRKTELLLKYRNRFFPAGEP